MAADQAGRRNHTPYHFRPSPGLPRPPVSPVSPIFPNGDNGPLRRNNRVIGS
jgi:hypothetical protein